jgi:hypothetical protein
LQREEKYIPLLTKGDGGGLDSLFQSAKRKEVIHTEKVKERRNRGDG